MKRQLSYLFFFLIFISLSFSVFAEIESSPFVVVIDPGHGGKDPGAIGRKGKEKDINLAVALLLGDYIKSEHPDVKITYTRNRDVFIGLDERANIANKENANLFISIHANASKTRVVNGAEVFTFGLSRTKENLEVAKRENSAILLEDNYKQKYEGFDPNSAESYIIFEFMQNKFVEQSVDFAIKVQQELVKTAKRENRGVKQAEYLVLRKSSMPRILIELDFISNANAESYMLSKRGQQNMARSICNAFTKYKNEFDKKTSASNQIVSTTQPEQVSAQTKSNETPIQKNNLQIDTTPKQETASVQETHSITEEKTLPSGKIYKVQILASRVKLPEKSRELKGNKANYYFENNYYKYTVGETSSWDEILKIHKSLLKDFKDAFIVTFENGIKK